MYYELCIMNYEGTLFGLDPGTRRIHPQIANVAAYNWFPCQARDDVMCECLNWKRT